MKISVLPMEALLSKLGSQSTGFNTRLSGVSGTYGIQPFKIEFPNNPYAAPTKSFLFGQLRKEDILESGIIKFPLVTMYVADSTNQNEEKPRDFSGVVRIGIDFFLSWLRGNVDKVNFEAMSMAVEDALAQVIQPWDAQNWGAGVIYNGAFSLQRSPLEMAGTESWLQVLGLRLAFQVDVGG